MHPALDEQVDEQRKRLAGGQAERLACVAHVRRAKQRDADLAHFPPLLIPFPNASLRAQIPIPEPGSRSSYRCPNAPSLRWPTGRGKRSVSGLILRTDASGNTEVNRREWTDRAPWPRV